MTEHRFARLHLFTLGSFAFAQPLYDLLGRNAEFLVAHHAGRGTIAALVLSLSVAIPLIVVGAVEALRPAGRRTWTMAHRAALFLLAALIVAGALNRHAARFVLPLAALAGLAAVLLYRARAVRTFVTLLSPAVVFFPLVFLFGTPVWRLINPAPAGAAAAALGESPTIVFVIFDELDTISLLDRTGAIDAALFPGFAGLLQTSTWFPNALAASPYTRLAIPAMLTGVEADPADGKLPMATDYPQNLFTWLAGTHALNVLESVSALCPADVCAAAASVDSHRFALDIAVLYLHLVTPGDLADRHLPPLAFAWKDFGGRANAPMRDEQPAPITESVLLERLGLAVAEGRGELFRTFVRSLRASSTPSLHFAHVLLPHDPYEFLPSGATYAHGGLPAGMADDSTWTSERALVETGRDRHIAQVQFVDKLLGELVAHLKDQGLFDSSLLIVASDHGSSFRPGAPHRVLKAANYRELLAAPLFVKRPGQRVAVIDERPASGIDILPTIADLMRTTLPWRTDGHSVFSPDFPTRSTVAYKGSGLEDLPTTDVRAVAGEAGRPHRDPLVGRRLEDLNVDPGPQTIQVFSESYRALREVRPESRSIPALVSGRIEVKASEPVGLAIALNGTIQAVTRTGRWHDHDHFFTALLPELAIHSGENRLEILIVDRTAATVRLSKIGPQFPDGLTISREDGADVLLRGSGVRLALRPAITGVIDSFTADGEGVLLHGWAVDRKSGRRLTSVVAFTGRTAVAFTIPRGHRPDVAAALGIKDLADAAFGIYVHFDDVRSGQLRLFGIADDSTAGELQISERIRADLQRHKTP